MLLISLLLYRLGANFRDTCSINNEMLNMLNFSKYTKFSVGWDPRYSLNIIWEWHIAEYILVQLRVMRFGSQSHWYRYSISCNICTRYNGYITSSCECVKSIIYINSLWLSDAICRQRSGSTLAQVMACCLTAPSHYLNRCWLIVSEIQRHSPRIIFYERCLNHQSLKWTWKPLN